MDAGGDHGSAAKGSAIDLEVAGSGPVSCRFLILHQSGVINSWCGNFKGGSG